eukprot:m51a1_g11525 hypothetical protein (278) ;mRNA; r:7390-10354
MLARGLQASAYWHAEDHFFTYLKWSLNIMRDMAQSVSKESIMEAKVKQAQAGEKQKKMKKSTLDNKKIKATLKLNVGAIESKGVSIQDSYKIYSQVKELITALNTKDKELCSFSKTQLRVLKNAMGPVTAAIMWGKLTKESEINAASKNMDRYSILSEKPVMVNWNELVYPAKSIQDSYKIYSQVKELITALNTKDKELCSFSKTQLRVLKNAMGPVTAAIMWGKLTKESEINAASKNMDRYSILSEKPVMVNWNELVYPAKLPLPPSLLSNHVVFP